MWCNKFKCTMSVNDCIKRHRYILKEGQTEFELSLQYCRTCEQGKAVTANPKGFINRDVNLLKKEYEGKNNNGNGKRKTIDRRRIDKLFNSQRYITGNESYFSSFNRFGN